MDKETKKLLIDLAAAVEAASRAVADHNVQDHGGGVPGVLRPLLSTISKLKARARALPLAKGVEKRDDI